MSAFLESVDIERYGAFNDRQIGPFAPGLNVVYGPNEAGKSTIASFVGSVLFGWDEARGVRNTYRSADGERAGALRFRKDGEACVVRRAPGEDGLSGDVALVSDVDPGTYRTMFSLTSDEIRSLSDTSDVASRLLTAGSGTGGSPADAFVEIEQRIAACCSKADGAEQSIFSLLERSERQREEVKNLSKSVELRKQEARELRELEANRAAASEKLDELNGEAEALASAYARAQRVDEQIARQQEALAVARADGGDLAPSNVGDSVDRRLLALDTPAERSLRDKLDEFADEQAKLQRGIDIARENSAASSAAYEALMELESDDAGRERPLRRSMLRMLGPGLLSVAFVVIGVFVFMNGRTSGSLSFTALGIGLVVFAVFLATAAIAVLLRSDKGADALEERRKDAQWVMLQDKRKLDANLAAKEAMDTQLSAFLDDNGLAAANGSVRQARALLDDARDVRQQLAEEQQKSAALAMRLDSIEQALAELAEERRLLEDAAGLGPGAPLREFELASARKAAQRDAQLEASEEMNRRVGELRERIEASLCDRSFDRAKLAYEQTRTELRERKRQLVSLLLAKRMLEKSIAAWEGRSQPEVFAEASRLLAIITQGAWVQIAMTAEGRIVASAADGVARDTAHLSLGTSQQLYLSLRVAMLLHAGSVGHAIPVLADDILVNFDAQRRVGAARALAELAKKRQVIVFTCHRETVESFRQAQSDLNYLELR